MYVCTLNKEETKATVGDTSLEKGEIVEYIVDEKQGSGVIEQFWMIDKKDMASVWMKLRDMNGGDNVVMSLRNWKNDLVEGYIKN